MGRRILCTQLAAVSVLWCAGCGQVYRDEAVALKPFEPPPELVKYQKAVYDASLSSLLPTPSEAIDPSVLSGLECRTRLVKAKYEEVSKSVKELFEKIRKDADLSGKKESGITLFGIGSGIAGAALIVASPANAVYAAVFSGLSGGASAYQGGLSTLGLTRQAVHREYSKLVQEYKTLVRDYSHGIATMENAQVSPKFTWEAYQKWTEGRIKAEGAVNELWAITVIEYLPIGQASEMTELGDRLDKLDELIKKRLDLPAKKK